MLETAFFFDAVRLPQNLGVEYETMRRLSARLPGSLLFPPQISAACVTVDLCFISLRSVVFTSAPHAPASSTDPARLGEEQPDPALLSETGPAAAPGPGDQHGRAGVCVFSLYSPHVKGHILK